jgi:uncharacterized repeat protein (TIGR01451 family)
MKRTFCPAIAILSLVLLAAGCSLFEDLVSSLFEEQEDDAYDGILKMRSPSEAENYQVPDNFLGEWVDIKTGETRYINIRNGSGLTRVSDRVITDGKTLLYPVRIANAHFTGKITGFSQTAQVANRAVAGGKGWITVVLNDLDSGKTTTTTTDEDGDFTAEEVILGDDYVVTPERGTPTTVTPIVDGEDIGTITVVDPWESNFKASINASFTQKYYAEDHHSFTITVTNTGTVDATAATYKLTMDDGVSLVNGNDEGLLGTIEPNRTKNIDVQVKCSESSIRDYFALKTIGVQIDDQINQRTWNDSVSLRFHKKESVSMIVAVPSNGTGYTYDPYSHNPYTQLNGVLVAPNGQVYRFSINARRSASDLEGSKSLVYEYAEIELPPVLNGNFLLVFCGADANTETPYFVRFVDTNVVRSYNYVDVEDVEALNNFMDVARYEPNNTEQTATVPDGNSFFGYLHKDDFDYYKFRLSY